MAGLECGHFFCTACWTDYLTTKIMDEGESQTIRCPASQCNTLVDDEIVTKLISDPKIKLKYQHLISDDFVQVRNKLQSKAAANFLL